MKNLKNEKAVSPVIGVILMVVITVIIAAILAVFAFGMGGPAKAPEAQLRYQAVNSTTGGNTSLSITNAGGDSLILKDEQLTIVYAADGTSILPATNMSTWATGNPQYLAPGVTINGNFQATPKGAIVRITVLDLPTGQMVSDSKITVQ